MALAPRGGERVQLNRRQLMFAGLATMVRMPARGQSANASRGVKALVFDTFGTVVDWRGSIIAEGEAWGKAKGLNVDWPRFADRWRAGYAPAMDKVRKGEMPWTKLDTLHRMLLEDLLKELTSTGRASPTAGAPAMRPQWTRSAKARCRGPNLILCIGCSWRIC